MIPSHSKDTAFSPNFSEEAFLNAVDLIQDMPYPYIGCVNLSVSTHDLANAARLKVLINSSVENFSIDQVIMDPDLYMGAFYVEHGPESVCSRGC